MIELKLGKNKTRTSDLQGGFDPCKFEVEVTPINGRRKEQNQF